MSDAPFQNGILTVGQGQPEIIRKRELKQIDTMELAHLRWKLDHQMVQELPTALRL